MKKIGLTGGIASGKSTVSGYLKQKGIWVVDADAVSRELTQPGGAAIPAIQSTFGDEYILPDGALDRKKMGALVFADASKRETLNALLHPMILSEINRRMEAAGGKLAVVDAALLIETGLYRQVDEIWLVTVDKDTQLRRLMQRDGFSAAEAASRIRSQMPTEQKKKYADRCIDNSGELSETYRQVDEILGEII